MFDLAIDSKLRGCNVVKIRIGDIVIGGRIRNRAIIAQQKTGRPVQFELLDPARGSILTWLERRGGSLDALVFPSRINHTSHMSTRQYARLVGKWFTGIGLWPEDYVPLTSLVKEGCFRVEALYFPGKEGFPPRGGLGSSACITACFD